MRFEHTICTQWKGWHASPTSVPFIAALSIAAVLSKCLKIGQVEGNGLSDRLDFATPPRAAHLLKGPPPFTPSGHGGPEKTG